MLADVVTGGPEALEVIPRADLRSFAEVFEEQRPKALRLAYGMTGDAALAEDVVAEAFARTYRQWVKGRVQNPDAYVRRAVVNEVRATWRRLAVRRAHAAKERKTEAVSHARDDRARAQRTSASRRSRRSRADSGSDLRLCAAGQWPAAHSRERMVPVERSTASVRLESVQAVAPLAALDVRAEVLLDRLYRTHAPAALRFALMLTGDRALSEDLVQEAFIRVAAKLDGLREPSAFNAYLTRAVANLAKSHFRRQEVAKRHVRTIDISTLVEDPVDVVTQDALLVALRRLPLQQRAALVLRYYNDCSQEEIARVLDCPVGTVKSALSRGLARLRQECGDD